MTKCLDDRSIVGEGIPIRLRVSSLKELKLECLRCLNQTIERTVYGQRLRPTLCLRNELAQGFNNGNDGDGGAVVVGCIKTTANDISRDKGAHAIVDSNQTLLPYRRGIGRDAVQPILHTMETSLATSSDRMSEGEGMAEAKLTPEILLVGREYQDDMNTRNGTLESFERAHQYGFSADRQELFGQVCTHAQTLASGDNNSISHKLLHAELLFTIQHPLTQGFGCSLILHVGHDGIAEFKDSGRTFTSDDLSVLFHESTCTSSTRQFPFKTGVTGGALSLEKAQTAENERSSTDCSDRTTEESMIADALTEVCTSGEVRSSWHSTGEDEQVGIEEVDVIEECIGLDANAVSTCYDALTSDRYDLQVEACTTDDVSSSKSFQLFGASGEK